MTEAVMSMEKISQQIEESNYISRDLSCLQFNYRVLDQARHVDRSIFDRLKYLSITASNLDEFCTIRLGSLYNYIDYGKERFDYNGLREEPFRILLLGETRRFYQDQNEFYVKKFKPLFESNGFMIAGYADLSAENTQKVNLQQHHFSDADAHGVRQLSHLPCFNEQSPALWRCDQEPRR
jgi:polyphosphate kinase